MILKTMRPSSLLLVASLWAEAPETLPHQFLFGENAYPELQSRADWKRTIDTFEKAHCKGVRVSESSWGNLETTP